MLGVCAGALFIVLSMRFTLVMFFVAGVLALGSWLVFRVRWRSRGSIVLTYDQAARRDEPVESPQHSAAPLTSQTSAEPVDSTEREALKTSGAVPEDSQLASANEPPLDSLPAGVFSPQVTPNALEETESEQRDLSDSVGGAGSQAVDVSTSLSASSIQQVDSENIASSPEDDGVRQNEVVCEEKSNTEVATEQELIEIRAEDSDTEELAQGRDDSDSQIEELTENQRTHARYRAPQLTSPKPRTKKQSESRPKEREQILELRVRALSDRHGYCRFHILAQRPPGGPVQLEARIAGRTTFLTEVGDEWYQIQEGDDVATCLEHGIKFSTSMADREQRWELRGRDLYVLASSHGVSGFVSTARLCIGREQIVLCRESQAAEVETILAEAGCAGLHAHGAEKGSPAGWVFFRPVPPSRSVPQVPGDNILNLIRPVPDIEVLLEGGLWLQDSAWMAGYPPRIHITGEVPAGTRVTIDGEVAEETDGSVYRTGDSERTGTHVVWCAGKSASYSICELDEGWEQWEAYQFPRGSVCGAVATRASNAPETLTSVPTTNPVLIGANRGEIFRCDVRPGKQWTGFVPFPVCWALPADPLHCDRSLRRVLLITPVPPVHSVMSGSTKVRVASSVLQWCYAIRDCQRKRLALSPGDTTSEQLWKEYTREAKAVWRAAR